jgi:tetratricopeptide repeat protein
MNFFQKLFGGKEETKEEIKVQNETKNFDVLKYDGVRAMKTGEVEYAIRCFKHALEIKDDLEIHDHLSVVYASKGMFPEAYEELQTLSKAQPDNVQIFIRMANIAFMMENYGAMATACEKAILLDSENATAHYLYAEACKGQGDDVNTIAMATKAISIDNKQGNAYLLRGETYLRTQQLSEAEADADWLLEHTEDNEDVLLLKARIERAVNRNNESIEYFTKAIDANPFSYNAFKERSELYSLIGNEAKAKEDAERAEELKPTDGKENAEENIEKQLNDKYKQMNPYGF